MVKQCVTLHKCVCNFTHSFWFCKFMLFFREEISVTIYARFCVKFSHIKLCWWKIWGMMRMFLMILMFITMMIKRIWIASDQIVLWIHSQWYNALKHLQNKMVDMIKMDVMLSTFPSEFFLATKLFLSSTESIVFLREHCGDKWRQLSWRPSSGKKRNWWENWKSGEKRDKIWHFLLPLSLESRKGQLLNFRGKIIAERESFPSIERDLLVESESETAGEGRVNIGEDPRGTQGLCERNPAGVAK